MKPTLVILAAVTVRLWLAWGEEWVLLTGLAGVVIAASGLQVTTFMRREEFTGEPEKVGTRAPRIRAAMQPPARVPVKRAPVTTALITRPDGAKVTITRALPAGSPSRRQPDAEAAAEERAALAAAVLKGGAAGALADLWRYCTLAGRVSGSQ